jgi:hypothetical protein
MRFYLALFGILALAADPTKPVWAPQFDAGFGLTDVSTTTPVVNATSHFYYHWTDLEATRIDYPYNCIQVFPGSQTQKCQIFFNPNGTYFSQPGLGAQYQCCLLFPGVGSVPPTFLQGFNYTSTQVAPDWYGTYHQTYYWTGEGFAYWTDQATGADIFFNDGGSGTFWSWGTINFASQDPSLFTLPGTTAQCQKLCVALEPDLDLDDIIDPMLNLARHYHEWKSKN